jgi:hypothetical protein
MLKRKKKTMRGTTRCAAVVALLLLAGCSTITDIWTGGPREQPRVRKDATQLACDAGKTLLVRRDPGSIWMILPDREFRLDAVEGSGERYSNGRTTLTITGGTEVSVEEAGAPLFSACRVAG